MPITIIENSSKEDIFLIEIKKKYYHFKEDKMIYKIYISNIEEVDEK